MKRIMAILLAAMMLIIGAAAAFGEEVTIWRKGDSGEEIKQDALLCEIWPGPFNYHTTPEESKESAEFSFDEDGVTDAISWMNDKLAEDPDKWEKAATNWKSYSAE